MIDHTPDYDDLEDTIWLYARSQGVSSKSAEYVVQHAVAQISMDIDHMLRKEPYDEQR